MRKVKLADCCKFYSGGTPTKGKREFWNGELPWFSPKDIKSFELFSSQDRISDVAVLESATRLLQPGAILVVGRSGVLAHTLPVGIVRQPSAFNQDIKAIVPSDGYDSEYIALYLAAKQNYILKEGVKRGPTVHSLISNFIEELEIPDIQVKEQRQIATRLKTQLAEVETARQAAKTQLQEVAALKSKALEALFAGIKNWEPIGSAAKLQSGYAFKSDTFKTTGVRLLRNANILPGRVYWDDAVCLSEEDSTKHPSYVLKDGDVLISLDRPIISSGIKVARVGSDDLPALLVQRVGRFLIDPDKLDADYLYACLQTDLFIAEISGHDQSLGVPHISPSQVESVLIPLPDVAVQRELSKRMNEVTFQWQTAAAAMRGQLNDFSQLPKAILAQAFNQ